MTPNDPLDPKSQAQRPKEEDPTLLRRLFDSSLSAILNIGEDVEKSGVRPVLLSKEFLGNLSSSIVSQFERSKGDVITLFGREFKRFLDATDLSEEIVKALSQMTIEVKAEFKFKRSTESEEPKKRVHVKVERSSQKE